MVKQQKRLGIIATGDEIANGDILNTNGRFACQKLIEHDIIPGRTVMVSDETHEITNAINYLRQDHDAIMTIGGLGPTEDDRTRFALAASVNLELEFYPEAWQWIIDRITPLGLKVTENNRQQALLPQGTEAIFNPNGTACGCYFDKDDQQFFMLPGPPNEFHSLFTDFVIPKLIEKNFQTPLERRSWLLLGVSESAIADTLEPLAKNYPDCQLGYRVSYPYLEIKLSSANQPAITALSLQFNQLFHGKIISAERKTASQQYLDYLINTSDLSLNIDDQATGGRLEKALLTPQTYHKLTAKNSPKQITIEGLTEYWMNKKQATETTLTITINDQRITKKIPLRSTKTLIYAVEIICLELLNHL